MMKTPEDVHRFWFGELGDGTTLPRHYKMWFDKNDFVDAKMKKRFAETVEAVAASPSGEWLRGARNRVSLVVLLDQFPRNIYRGTTRAFAFDATSLRIAEETVEAGLDRELTTLERAFLYLPFEHAEDPKRQARAVELFTRLNQEAPASLKEYTADNLLYAKRHAEIITRFGRFPHRNAILGRPATEAETAFLKEPMSSF